MFEAYESGYHQHTLLAAEGRTHLQVETIFFKMRHLLVRQAALLILISPVAFTDLEYVIPL